MNVKSIADSKIQHFQLNMDYLAPGVNLENRTNFLISNKINYLINNYGVYFKDTTFVLQYNDDVISVIAYHMLKSLSEISDFHFVLIGKKKRTKKYLNKKDKFISIRKLRGLSKYKYISILNPIYNVVSDNDFYKNLGAALGVETIYLMKDFTVDEIFKAQEFYGIGYIEKEIDRNNKVLNELTKWYNEPAEHIVPPPLQRKVDYNSVKINLVWLSGNLEKDNEVLQDVQDSDNINFYCYYERPQSLYGRNWIAFSHYVKNKSNIPNKKYMNLEADKLIIYLIISGCKYECWGEWPDRELNYLLNGGIAND